MIINENKQHGAVSLFVVIFTALLITIITVSFVRIMIQDQQQATTTDLSQSAYDSAQAGVEDAKRALLRYQSICNNSDKSACDAAQAKINSSTCNTAVDTLTDVTISGGEVKVQTGGSNALNQAYTCSKIDLDTIDYLGTLIKDESDIIPLTSVDPFNTIQVQWFSSDNLSSGGSLSVNLQPAFSSSWPLLAQTSWSTNRPPIMRTQMIQFGSGFTLSDFNDMSSSESNAKTLFLYPSGTTGVAITSAPGSNTKLFKDRDIRRTPTGSPTPITCSGNLVGGGYACTAKLVLPESIGGGQHSSFLRLSALYNKASYRVTLLNGVTPVEFNAVQPEIDSTGRANDLFRRVKTRVELTDVNFPYPEAAVDITDNFCKYFTVTDVITDYNTGDANAGKCTP